MEKTHFYAVIIGSEILNGRRSDKHFAYLRDALLARGHVLYASFVVKDDPDLIRTLFKVVRNDPQGVMFSFGGIGSTPDDLTRQIAAEVFSDGMLYPNETFRRAIVERFGEAAHPHRIHMAELPSGAGLLRNVVNNMSGFYLEERYFFMPGFPEMSHPMVDEVLERFYPDSPTTYRRTLIAQTSENTLIDVMKRLDERVELSSLPMLRDGHATVEISVASFDQTLSEKSIGFFIEALDERQISYRITG